MTPPIVLRRLESLEELKAVQRLERTVWGMDPIPLHQTLTAVKNGGLLLGGFHNDRLVGFCYAFPGFDGKRTYLCSHMMGVEPAYRGIGLGKRMKWDQRKWALSMGYSLITWTFDPLESINASLNLNALRAICDTYIENCYGEMDDELNRGLPTDRFQVEWWIDSPHVTTPAPPTAAVGPDRRVCGWFVNPNGLPNWRKSGTNPGKDRRPSAGAHSRRFPAHQSPRFGPGPGLASENENDFSNSLCRGIRRDRNAS